MDIRNTAIGEFLITSGWANSQRDTLEADASSRKYERLRSGSNQALLMICPPEGENIYEFIKVTNYLLEKKYSVPIIFSKDPKKGLLIIEDFGDTTFMRAAGKTVEDSLLYSSALEVLIKMHSNQSRDWSRLNLPAYNTNLLLEELSIFCEWYLPNFLKNKALKGAIADFQKIWIRLISEYLVLEPTLVLRDFHADNLFWLPKRKGEQRCGLIDYQDAVIGSPTYDLMSLLEDARRDIPTDLYNKIKGDYILAFPDLDITKFNKEFALLSAQRHCKVLGIFSRLCQRDNKNKYLEHMPRVWHLLEKSCQSAFLAPLETWLNEFIPFEKRYKLPTKSVR